MITLQIKVKRGVEALFSGDDYGKDLRDSVNTIQSKSKSLMDEASKSYMFQQEMRKNVRSLLFIFLTSISGWKQTQLFQDHASENLGSIASGFNSLNDLFTIHIERKDRKHLSFLSPLET